MIDNVFVIRYIDSRKWERGLSLPDISILQSLADILSVTVSEILNGEKAVNQAEQTMVSVKNALDYAKETRAKASKKILDISAITYSTMLIIGILLFQNLSLGRVSRFLHQFTRGWFSFRVLNLGERVFCRL